MRLVACAMLVGVVAGAVGAPVPKDDGPKAGRYYPARKGDKWTYEVRYSNPNSGVKDYTTEVTVAAVERKGADIVVATDRTFPNGKARPRAVVVVSAQGLDVTEDSGVKWSSPVPLLRLPPRPGERVEVNATREDKLEYKGKVTNHPAEEVETPSGKYKAVRSEFEGAMGGKPFRRVLWFADGVGLVKDVQSSEVFGRTTTVELVLKKFTPAKP